MSEINTTEWVTTHEAAEFLNISRSALQELVANGLLSVYVGEYDDLNACGFVGHEAKDNYRDGYDGFTYGLVKVSQIIEYKQRVREISEQLELEGDLS